MDSSTLVPARGVGDLTWLALGGEPPFAAPANLNGEAEQSRRSGRSPNIFPGASAAKVGSEPCLPNCPPQQLAQAKTKRVAIVQNRTIINGH